MLKLMNELVETMCKILSFSPLSLSLSLYLSLTHTHTFTRQHVTTITQKKSMLLLKLLGWSKVSLCWCIVWNTTSLKPYVIILTYKYKSLFKLHWEIVSEQLSKRRNYKQKRKHFICCLSILLTAHPLAFIYPSILPSICPLPFFYSSILPSIHPLHLSIHPFYHCPFIFLFL